MRAEFSSLIEAYVGILVVADIFRAYVWSLDDKVLTDWIPEENDLI